MKKLLSILLTAGLSLSLFGTTAFASTTQTDLKDYADIAPAYREAVSFIVESDIMSGYMDGSFMPANILTRGAAAKILANLAVGPDLAFTLATTTAPFPDVPVDHVFSGYVSYCVAAGI